MAVRMSDIAKRAKVSRSTVSLALSDKNLKKYKVCPETVARVRRIAADLGYRPNKLGVALVSARTHTIGLLLGTQRMRASHGTEVDGISAELGENFTIFSALFSDQTAVDQEKRALMAFLDYRVDGIIALWSGNEETIETYRDVVERHRVPLVLLQRGIPGLKAPVVAADYRTSTFEAVKALHRLGHRRIALMSHSENRRVPLYTEDERDGYETAMDSLGCGEYKRVLLPEQFGISEQQDAYLAEYSRAVAARLRSARECTAIITIGDYLALSLIVRCRREGLSVPGDISVIGTGNFEFTSTEQADISSVDEHHEQIGQQAARILVRKIEGHSETGKTWKAPVEVVLRGTTAPMERITGK